MDPNINTFPPPIQSIAQSPPPATTSTDDYVYDPASSPQGNLIGSEAGFALALFFAFFAVVSVCGMCLVKLHNRRAAKRRLKEQQKHDDSLEVGICPDGNSSPSPDEKSHLAHVDDKNDPFLVSGEDDSFSYDLSSPATAGAMAKPTIREVNPSLTSFNNFSRPGGGSRNGSGDTVVQHLYSPPTMELGRLDTAGRKEKIRKMPTYDALYQDEWPSPPAIKASRG
jgi:hypothetical protein